MNELFYLEYNSDGKREMLEVEDEAITIDEIVEHFKTFLRGMYAKELVDNVRYLGPECK